MKRAIFGLAFVLLSVGGLHAQGGRALPDLVFPTAALEGSAAIVKLGTVLAKPPGPGPFPALVIMQTCSGATPDQRDWGRRAVDHGYVALVVDSMTPRGVTSGNCNLPLPRRMLDVQDAREHLKRFEFVDQDRIGLMGFSVGANTSLQITTHIPPFTQAPSYKSFPAVVTFYGACVVRGQGGLQSIFKERGPDAPLLMLIGEADPQARVGDCVPELERLKNAGADVEWKVYPRATHCFDCRSESGKVADNTIQGGRMNFTYDEAATNDAADRAFAFFASRMKKAQ
jgi:dienelactone hydrolase